MIDLAIVCFEDETPLLELQLRSFDRHLDPALPRRIWLFNNGADQAACRDQMARAVADEAGRFADRIEIVDGARFGISPTTKRESYFGQQALKLLASRCAQTPWYLALDAKNHLIAPYAAADVFAPNGRPWTFHATFDGAHARRREASHAALDAPFDPETSGLPMITPFALSRPIAQSLTTHLERRFGPLFAFLLDHGRASEFFLYAAYLARLGIAPDDLYAFGSPRFSTLFGKSPSGDQRVLSLLEAAVAEGRPMLGVHRNRFEQLNAVSAAALAGIWVDAGLFDDGPGAHAFIAEMAARPRVFAGGPESG